MLSLQTLEFLSYPSKHWNSTPVFINIRILILSFKKFDAFILVFITFITLIFLFIVCCVSLLCFLSLYSAGPFQASFMVLSAPNLVFVGCVAFSLVFLHLFLLYKFYWLSMSFPPFSELFLIVCCFFSPCEQHIILVFYFTYTFHLYFAVHVFSESILFRISCSLLLFNPDLLLITFSYLQLVAL